MNIYFIKFSYVDHDLSIRNYSFIEEFNTKNLKSTIKQVCIDRAKEYRSSFYLSFNSLEIVNKL